MASGENFSAMRCFEVVDGIVFVCWADGKMSIFDENTQAALRKPVSAHASEIKHITRGHGGTILTSCVDNQVGARTRRQCRRGASLATPRPAIGHEGSMPGVGSELACRSRPRRLRRPDRACHGLQRRCKAGQLDHHFGLAGRRRRQGTLPDVAATIARRT